MQRLQIIIGVISARIDKHDRASLFCENRIRGYRIVCEHPELISSSTPKAMRRSQGEIEGVGA